MKLTLHIWRQKNSNDSGRMVQYTVSANEHMSFLEMLDVLNEELTGKGDDPIAFDHDCREGICGSCGFMINGQGHGPERATATCQLHMRKFRAGDHLTIDPRSTLARIIGSGGYVGVGTGGAPDGNLIPIPKPVADAAMDAAACIGCGACVAACPNGAAQLFTSAKMQHLNLLPQGQAERWDRTINMVETMESYFGSCTNHRECEAACPKEISIDFIALMNKDYLKAQLKQRRLVGQSYP